MDNKGNMSLEEIQEFMGTLAEHIENLEDKLGDLDGGDSQAFYRIKTLEIRQNYLTWAVIILGAIVIYKFFIA